MTHGSLFSGIGGFDLAAAWAGIPTLWQVEIDPYCRAVLQKHFPEAKIHEDIKKIKKGELEPVDIISGGFPCQPFSVAGKRRGKADDRYLWPEMLRIISEIRPTWAICENVPGIISMEPDNCISDLEAEGYEVQTFIVPACAVDAPHRRDRVWIVAHSNGGGLPEPCICEEQQGRTKTIRTSQNLADAACELLDRNRETRRRRGEFTDGCRWLPEPGVGRVAHGVPRRVGRLRALGNAIVPQVAYQIFKTIMEVENDIHRH